MLEKQLERIADALEKIAGRFTDFARSPVTTYAKPEPTETVTDAPSVFDDPTPAPTAPAPKAGRPKSNKTAPSAPVAPVATVATVAPVATVTKDEAMDLLREFVRVKGPEGQTKGRGILMEFGAGKVSELDPKHYADFAARLKKELAA